MATLASLTQVVSGNPVYENFYRQVDPENTGRVGPTEAALFLKKSGLPDSTLGKIWDLADPEGKGYLDKQGFYVALRLVACAQSGQEVSVSNINQTVPPPQFKDTSSPSLSSTSSLSCELLWAVKPEEKNKFDGIFESLVPINGLLSGDKVRPVLINSKLPLDVLGKHSLNWVVPLSERGRYDDIFLKTDADLDGFVSGQEVKDIFIQSGLSQNILAHIWSLADTRQIGKLNREQFALAMHLIHQKVGKGIDPPQVLTVDMIPPSERGTPIPTMSGYMTPVGSEMVALSEMRRDSSSSVGSGEFSGIKELDDISQEIAQLHREKYTLDQDIREMEEAIRQKSAEVQEMQNDMDRETTNLQELEAQKQDAQDRLEEMEQQEHKLEDMLNEVRQKCKEESQLISTLQRQIHSQESDLQNQEEELSRAKADLDHLHQEERQLEQSLAAGKIQLETIIISLKLTQDEINQARGKLSQIQDCQQEMSKGIEQYSSTLNGTNGGSMTNLADMSEGFNDKESGGFSAAGKGRQEDIFKVKPSVFYNRPQDLQSDLFNSEDPFKTDPFKGDPFESDPFGKASSTSTDPFEGDPFKESDPFKASSEDFFKKTTKMDHFSTTDPFCKSATLPSKQTSHFAGGDPFSTNHQKPRGSDLFSTLDPFGSSTFNSATNSCTDFADFSHMSKARDPFEGRANWLPDYQKPVFVDDPFTRKTDMPALPPKRSIPPRPKPPSGTTTPVSLIATADPSKPCDPFQAFGADVIDHFQAKKGLGDPFSGKDPFIPSSASSNAPKESTSGFTDVSSFGNEAQQLEWAKRESERAERDRLKRLRQQEQEDLELAIALSKAEMSNA
ncbi:epidermal growth factor receptor substrate 15-like 1 isoform X5 [Xiphophorus couchianus]|uniref:epidermal growth factor receptor substrate 15-like 1 isoform X5 n=1 Tax=Xiphophorus couchianus TaxID=32473 RepID=UPI00101686BB|nr:epidermal growth factor receptor substrate 15-like 1 isoform X5 [Xiphophorus couchianus]